MSTRSGGGAMSRYQWRFVGVAAGAWAVWVLLVWLWTPSFGSSDDATWYVLQQTLQQVLFWIGVLAAGGFVALTVMRSDRADRYELDSLDEGSDDTDDGADDTG